MAVGRCGSISCSLTGIDVEWCSCSDVDGDVVDVAV